MNEPTTTLPTEESLLRAGFNTASETITRKRNLARKLRIAFEHFRVVEPQHIVRFNKELRERTEIVEGRNQWGDIRQYDQLRFTPIGLYPTIPPVEVIQEVLKAQDMLCFDGFEVCDIQSVKIIPDPIIFGVITGCLNKYYITQWDNDVKIEDILKPEEG